MSKEFNQKWGDMTPEEKKEWKQKLFCESAKEYNDKIKQSDVDNSKKKKS